MIPNEREIYLMNAINEKNDKYWDLKQETEQGEEQRMCLVAAGIVAAQKWDIDPAKIKIKLVTSLEMFKISAPSAVAIYDGALPSTTTPIREADIIDFFGGNGARWRKGHIDFWLAWGPITNTLVVCVREIAS